MMFDHAEIIRLTKAGASASQISERLGCSTRQVRRVRAKFGIAQPSPEYASKPITAERLAAIELMVADGASHAEIRRTLGVSSHTIARYFPGTGWTSRETGQFARAVRRSYDSWAASHEKKEGAA